MPTTTPYTDIFNQYSHQQIIVKLVESIRPTNTGHWPEAKQNLENLGAYLLEYPSAKAKLVKALEGIVANSDLQYIFSESGLPTGSGFFAELNQRLVNKFLPALLPNHDLRITIRQIFCKPWDYKWVNALPDSVWIKFFQQIHLQLNFQLEGSNNQLIAAGENLSYRIAALGLDQKLIEKAGAIFSKKNAFVDVQKTWERYKKNIENSGQIPGNDLSYNRMLECMDDARQQLKQIRKLTQESGTSLQQSFLLERLHQHLLRLQTIVTIIEPKVDVGAIGYTQYFKAIVQNEGQYNRIRPLLNRNFLYLAYQIAEHGSRTGEKYITTNAKEFKQFFISAAIGGFIISFAAALKMALTNQHLPYFWASFCYGINYASAFVIIHFLGGSVATKQPALTANTIAMELDNINPKNPDLHKLAILNAKVVRSQLIALIGNLSVVFPLCIGIAWAGHAISGSHLIPPENVSAMLNDVQLTPKNLWFAALAGVLLFGSGIVSGYFDNLVIYGKIPKRLRSHKGLLKIMSQKKLIAFSVYIENNLGALMGNILLGFGLGFFIFFGKIFGLPIDIRHVTISSGFFGFALVSLGFQLTAAQWWWCAAGLIGIAFTNLVVSFSLALFTAIKSRGLSSRQLLPLAKLTLQYFLRHPTDFVWPPKKTRDPNWLKPVTT